MAGVLLPAATTLFLSGTQKPAAGPAPPGSIAGMRAVAIVVAGLLSCAGAACGGASDAFSSSDSGMDATASESDGAPRSAVPDPGTGDPDAGVPPGSEDAGLSGDAPMIPATGGGDAALQGEGGPSEPADGSAVDDGAAPDGPVGGRIACGNTTCDTSTQFCCAMLDGGAGCQTSEQACLALAGVPRRCEKTADCPANNVCCYEFTSTPATTSCHANDCNGGNGMRVEACQSQGDCTTGTCAAHACVAGGSIQACAAFGTECP
jgi:hypothetical protein